MEVALDETQHIWRILRHTYSQNSIRTYPSMQETQANRSQETTKDVKKRGRKRKSDESELLKKIGRQKIEEKNTVKRKAGAPVVKEKKQSSSPVPVKKDSAPILKRGPRKVLNFSVMIVSRIKSFTYSIKLLNVSSHLPP